MGPHAPSVFLVATERRATSRMCLRCVGFNKRRICRDTPCECSNSFIWVEINANNGNVK